MGFRHNQVMNFLKISDDVQRLIFILKEEKLGELYLQHKNPGCLGYHIKETESSGYIYILSTQSQTRPGIYVIQKMYRFLCLSNSWFSPEMHNMQGGRKVWGWGSCRGRALGNWNRRTELANIQGGRRRGWEEEQMLASWKQPDVDTEEWNRSDFSKQPRGRGLAELSPCPEYIQASPQWKRYQGLLS